MRTASHDDEVNFAPVLRLNDWPCYHAGMCYAFLRHESESETRRDHRQDPVIAFTPVNHVCEEQRRIAKANGENWTLRPEFNWKRVAGRDGAMTIYHFHIALSGIQETVAECPTLSATIDRSLFRSANKLLRKYFPDYIDIRDAVAHTAETTRNHQKHDVHSVKDYVGQGIYISEPQP